MIENIILSDSIKDKIDIDQFNYDEIFYVQEIICKDEIVFVTFIYNDNLKIRKNYTIKSIHIEDDNYIFKEKLTFNFSSFGNTSEIKLITVCINAKLFWSNLDYVTN